MATTTTNALDGLLSIRDGYTSARWNFPDAVGSSLSVPAGIGNAVDISYSFLTSVPSYASISGFLAFTSQQTQITRQVLTSIEEIANIDFVETSGVGQMTFAGSAQSSGQGGYAYYPSFGYSYSGSTILSVTEQGNGGDVWINRYAFFYAGYWAPGQDGYATLLHEIGHALGLKHPFEASNNGYILNDSLDDESHTVMSYTEAPNSKLISVTGTATSYSWQTSQLRPSTLMPLDIEALQYLYGANLTTRTGNDTYQWALNPEIIETIWDAGGNDTIDCSNQTLTCVINLESGSYSSISLRQTDAEKRLGLDLPSWFNQALPSDIYDGSNNLAIAKGSIIENAKGGSAADTIHGNAAGNVLTGGNGNDSMFGYAGNDTLDGESGADTMTGGDGSDSYYVDNTGDVVTEINATAGTGGTDLVNSYLAAYTLGVNVENGRILSTGAANLTGNSLNNVLYARSGNNVLGGGTGTDTVDYRYEGSAVTVSLAVTTAQTTGGSGSDTLLGIENLSGSGYNDKLTGNTGSNVLNGGVGADTMTGGDGSDSYYVDNTGDVVTETNANASTGGIDLVNSYLSAYTLGANVENGRILATGSANLTGNTLNNVLYAGSGNNILGGSIGTDTADYRYAGSAVTVSLAIATAQTTGGSGSDILLGIESLNGSNYNDKLTGNAAGNVLNGQGGADTMSGGDGADSYYVDNSGDVVTETNATASTGGTDHVHSYLAAYTLSTNVENGRILATGTANLTGNTLNNVLYAGTGNNVLDGGTGIDTVSYACGVIGTTGVTVNLSLTTALATGDSGSDTLLNIENITGSNYNDTLTGNSGANILDGGSGIDTMTGGDGSDAYYVRDTGDTVIESNATASTGGTDLVYSYLAAYTLGNNVENGRILATGAANLNGNTLNNVLYAGTGNNVLNGVSGVDTVSYQYSAASVSVNLATTTAQATSGSGSDTLNNIDNLVGTNFHDTLVGDAFANTLDGLALNDYLDGGAGNDMLLGGEGSDMLIGSLGKDRLTGGLGNDVFDFNSITETGLTNTTWDVITDFVRGADKIDLSTIDANAATLVNDAFSSVIASASATAFSAAGQLKMIGDVLYGNTDTDASAEFAIQLSGISSLTTADFVL